MTLRRALAGAAVFAVAAAMSPFIGAGAAYAGTPSLAPGTAAAGATTPNPATGNSDTSWAMNFTPDQTCPLDSSSEGGNWSSFITPATTDVSQLAFNAGIPSGTGFTSNLFSSTGSQVKNLQVSAAPNRIISNVPTFKFSGNGSFNPGDIPPGAYKIGVACFNTADTQPRFPVKYYAKTVTLTADAAGGGFSQLDYQLGATALPPTAVTAAAGNQQCTATFTGSTSDPANSGYTAIAHPASGPDITAPGAGSPIIIPGLTNGTSYTVSVTATNSVGTSAPAAATNNPCIPVAGPRTNVQNLTAGAPAPGATTVTLTWNPPAANSPAATPVSYAVSWTGPTPGSASVPFGTNTYTATGLTTGSYTFTVTATYADAPTSGSPPQSVVVALTPNTVILQRISVTRPVGALVLTQVCGSNGTVPAEATASTGFPAGSLPTVVAVNPSLVGTPAANLPGSTPTTPTFGGSPDTLRPGYPYPTDANGNSVATYPTWCGINLANARFVTQGPGAGQYFATSGVINEVSVVDTTNTDSGWDVTGQVSNFDSGTDTFNGRQLGWTPLVADKTPAFNDGNGNLYTPNPQPGAAVNPNSGTTITSGLSTAKRLANTVAGSGLGITILDARVKLLIPVTSDSGTYIATLTITTA